MGVSEYVTPVVMLMEIVIAVMGIYTGYTLKKTFAYLFGFSFLVFAVYDYLNLTGMSSGKLSVVNLIAVLAAVIGMYLVMVGTKQKSGE